MSTQRGTQGPATVDLRGERNAPNLFVVGAPKTGTTSLARYLDHHSEVFAPTPKEPFYLAKEWPEISAQSGIVSLGDYLSLYEGAEEVRWRLDSSTLYLRSNCALKSISLLDGSARVIVGLRNPVDIAYSFYHEQVFGLNETRTFREAWEHSLKGRDQAIAPFLDYAQVGELGSQIRELLETVPRERCVFYQLQELKNEPGRLYARIAAFLELDVGQLPEFRRYNSARYHRFQRLSRAVLEPPERLAPAVLGIRNRLNRRPSRSTEAIKRFFRPPTSHEPLEAALRAEMQEYYTEQVAAVRRLVGIDLSG